MEKIHILLYYKFQPIEDVEYFIRVHKRKCQELEIVGKVLVGKEGVNGSVAGNKEQMEEYRKFAHSLEGFEDVWFKEEIGNEAPFNKMIVRKREEIVSLQKDVENVFSKITSKNEVNISENKKLCEEIDEEMNKKKITVEDLSDAEQVALMALDEIKNEENEISAKLAGPAIRKETKGEHSGQKILVNFL